MTANRIREGLTFDDVLLVPAESQVMPRDVEFNTRLTREIELRAPLVSAAMDTVTEHATAIAMAQHGGIGIIHRNNTMEQQAREVRTVKNFEVAGMIDKPTTLTPDENIQDAVARLERRGISGAPVVDESGRVIGMLTSRDRRDRRFVSANARVRDVMNSKDIRTVANGPNLMEEARKKLHESRLEKLPVVDNAGKLCGLITMKDIEQSESYPDATKDEKGHLRCGAAVGTGEDAIARTQHLVDVGVDVVVVDTAHGHSRSVLASIAELRRRFPELPIIGGNVATGEGAEALIKAGVSGVKVGVGPGSICTTRIVAGVGIPQLTAVMDAARAAGEVPVIADGGIRFSGDMVKALAGGAASVMMGSLFAGTDEAPGERILMHGRSYKLYRGMGSIGAMSSGSSDRYFQSHVTERSKFVPEGVEGRVPYRGSLAGEIEQLLGGLRSGMGYCGARTLSALQGGAQFVRISAAGGIESHVHDVTVTKEAPNYRLT